VKKCNKCEQKFPDHLVQPMTISDPENPELCYLLVCPICALAITNEVHGINRTGFSPGTRAQEMLQEARRFLKKGKR
jgi:hypothetical protein